MKTLFTLTGLLFLATALFGQTETRSLPFILQVDDDFPDPSTIHGVFRIMDSTKNVKDSINFDYHIGRLVMSAADYERFVNFNQRDRLWLRIGKLGDDSYTRNWYEISIPTEYINEEYPKGFINEEYIIVKIFNKSKNKECNKKYVFPNGKNYVSQIIIRGMSTIIPVWKK